MSLLADLPRLFAPGLTLGLALDAAQGMLERAGFSSVIYDYTPVPRAHDGMLITPNVLEARRVPDGMMSLWRAGFYQMDPVQDAALAATDTFVWTDTGRGGGLMESVLCERHKPVLGYMRDMRFSCGVTVPIHHPRGDLATFTAIRVDAEPSFAADARRVAPEIGVLGRAFHAVVSAGFDAGVRATAHVKLTPRERECLGLCAEGLTAKEIARRIGRSVPTVTLHLNSAARRLSARNRFQAVARAAHYRLLDASA